MKKFGIDISRWQGNFDFNKAINEGVEFVVIKGGGGDDGLYTDSKFNRNYNEAKAKGLPVGVYWFSKALTVAESEREAEYFYNNVIKGKQFELPVYMDVEHAEMLKLGRRTLTNIVKAFCEKMEALGCWVGIYSTPYAFRAYMIDEELTKYAHWVAQWAKKCTYEHTECFGMWQFGGETNLIRSNKIAGVTCDQNYMLVDYPALIKAAGLNGFTKTATEPAKPVLKPVEEIAKEVITGKWGNGEERKTNLSAAGYDYNAVQNIVNKKTAEKETEETVTYTVKAGDTLSTIAKKYGITYQKIAKDNGIKNANKIYAGQKLVIKK